MSFRVGPLVRRGRRAACTDTPSGFCFPDAYRAAGGGSRGRPGDSLRRHAASPRARSSVTETFSGAAWRPRCVCRRIFPPGTICWAVASILSPGLFTRSSRLQGSSRRPRFSCRLDWRSSRWPTEPAALGSHAAVGLVSNGSRGVLPPESDRQWAVSPAAVFQAPAVGLPRQYPDGRPVPFCFEPGLPLVSLANRPFPLTIPRPLIPLRFPGGRWQVVFDRLRARQCVWARPRLFAGRNNLSLVDIAGVNPAREPIEAPMAYGNNYLGDVYQLSVADRASVCPHIGRGRPLHG